MELKDLLAVAWKRRVAVLALFGLTMVFAALFAFSQPKRYESTAVLALTPDIKQGQGLFAADNLSALLGTYAETAKSTITLRRAQRTLGRPLNADIDASTEAGTGILRITATSTSASDAATAASAIATAFSDSISQNQVLDATLVDPPVPSTSPVQPRPPLILLVAAVLGAFAGVLLAFGLENFRRRIEKPADIAEHTPAPVLARLPRQRSLARASAQIIWGQDNSVGLQESYRALRTNLEFLLEDRSRVLEVTSPDPAQGKSTLVANLAVAFGQIGVETVIVDADLRRPRQHEIFGLANLEGVSTMLAARDSELYPVSSGHDSLWVLTSGPTPPEPTEMLAVRAAALAERLRSLNALVLIDGPPLLPVNDARLIAPHTDGVLMTLAARRSKPAAVEAAFQRLDLVGARTLGVVLNQSGEGTQTSGYYQRGPLVTG
jgi:polysaccharide biosynthesis transport protein